jgi:hypothetical protein
MRARRLAGLVIAVWALSAPVAVAGDEPEKQQASSQAPKRNADFLFGRPKGLLGVRGSWVFAGAGSDIFDFVTRHLTLDKKDFNSPGLAADVGFALTSRTDVQVGFELSRVSRGSEYRDYVDNRLQPIEQTTELNTTHIVGSLRYALKPKGQEISRLAWIPNRFVPYAGAGGGVIFYQFRQTGDFVDFQDLSVFPESFRSQGWAPAVHVFGGVDVKLHRALYATLQARYSKAAGELGSDFIDFDPIDLSGFRLSAGINVLF